jgi:beta-glucosidase
MNSYTDIDGIPVASDPGLLTEVLRDGWGFTGTVVSDDRGRGRRIRAGRWARRRAAEHGVLREPLLAEIAAGRVDEALVDRALWRVLAQKLQLGLLDARWSPEPLDDGIDFDSAGNRDIARRMAESSIVLLDNPTGLLPLQAPQRIAVIGPCADEPQTFFGCYAFPNHVIPQSPQLDQGIGIVADSLLDALRAKFPSAEVRYESGCLVSEGDLSGVAAAVDEAAAADVVVLAVGDRAGLFGGGTSGEGCDVEDLNLPGHQPELAEAILETGRPTVLISVSGRCTHWAGTRAGRRQSCRPSSPARKVGEREPGCSPGGSIPRASCRSRCRVMLVASRTHTSRLPSDKTPPSDKERTG